MPQRGQEVAAKLTDEGAMTTPAERTPPVPVPTVGADAYPKGTGSGSRSYLAGPTAEAPPAAEEARLWQGSGPRFMA